MTVLIPAAGALEEPISLLLPDTAVNDVLSMAAGRQDIVTVLGIIIVNRDSSARVVDVWWTNNVTDRLIFARSIATNETVIESLSAPIRLNAKSTARKIRAQASAAAINTVTVTLITSSLNEQASSIR